MSDTTEISPPPPPPAIDMTPGRYLRLRREAAGLPVPVVALAVDMATVVAIDGRPVPVGRRLAEEDRADLCRRIERLESDNLDGPGQCQLVDVLGAVFSFDQSVYWLLVGRAADPDGDVPEPAICRGCACTWNDPCPDGEGQCAWMPGDPSLCSACARKGPANDQGEASDAA